MNVTIIGGSGFIGTSLAKKLVKENISFKIGDLKSSQLFPKYHEFTDVRSELDLANMVTGDVVLNLSAVHRDDITAPEEYYATNVEGAKNLCKVCEEKNVKKIIFTSSVAVYGHTSKATSEDGDINPINHYGRSKALAEDVYLDWYNRDPQARSLVIIRPTVVFGEGNRGNVYNLFAQIHSRAFVMIGKGDNVKSIAYVENLSSFILASIFDDTKFSVYNYVDTPNLNMNELVRFVRLKLFSKSNVGMRIPKSLGLLIGKVADLVSSLGLRLPISSVRVEKFCASSEFTSQKEKLVSFRQPYSLEEALERTIDSEFLNPKPDRQIFYTE